MCRVELERDSDGRPTGRLLSHLGLCRNALWFDVHDGDTIFLCRHPNNDPAQPPTMTCTLSLAAWAEIVAYIQSQLPVSGAPHG